MQLIQGRSGIIPAALIRKVKTNVGSSALNILHVCSGVGMHDLGVAAGLEGLGIQSRTVAHVEWETFAASQLIALMEAECLDAAPVWCGDMGTFDAKPFRGVVDLIVGGLPCQPYSAAGKRKGNTDARSYGDGDGPIPQFLRIVAECDPAVVFLENVPAWVVRGWFRPVGEELCRLGYELESPLFLGANDVGASHRRERVWILAFKPGRGQRVLRESSRRHGQFDGGDGALEDAGISISGVGAEDESNVGRQGSSGDALGTIDELDDVSRHGGDRQEREGRRRRRVCGASGAVAHPEGEGLSRQLERRFDATGVREELGVHGTEVANAGGDGQFRSGSAHDDHGRDALGNQPDGQDSTMGDTGRDAGQARRPDGAHGGRPEGGHGPDDAGDALAQPERAERRPDLEHQQLPGGRQQETGGPGGAGCELADTDGGRRRTSGRGPGEPGRDAEQGVDHMADTGRMRDDEEQQVAIARSSYPAGTGVAGATVVHPEGEGRQGRRHAEPGGRAQSGPGGEPPPPSSRPVQSILDGRDLSPTTRTLRPRLNPAFVLWLMGLPGWWTSPAVTNSVRSEMAAWRCALRSRLRYLLGE